MGRRVPRTVGWSFVAASLVASLGACSSGSAEPAPMPSVKPSPSASTTQAAAPTMPAAARGTDAKAAKAFVSFWVQQLNYSGQTGNARGLQQISDPTCQACRAVIRQIQGVHRAGGRFIGRGWAVETVEYQPMQSATRPVLTVGLDIGPQTVISKAGAKPEHFGGGKRSMIFRLQRARGEWSLRELDQLS